MSDLMTIQKFPVIKRKYNTRNITEIPWIVAERCYRNYSGWQDQSLERIAERGGFAETELDRYAPGWEYEAKMYTARNHVAFLLSCVMCKETLSDDEINSIRESIRD